MSLDEELALVAKSLEVEEEVRPPRRRVLSATERTKRTLHRRNSKKARRKNRRKA